MSSASCDVVLLDPARLGDTVRASAEGYCGSLNEDVGSAPPARAVRLYVDQRGPFIRVGETAIISDERRHAHGLSVGGPKAVSTPLGQLLN